MTPSGEYVSLRRAKNGEWYFVHVAANGEPLETSETYTRHSDAERGAATAHPGMAVFSTEPEDVA